MATVTGTLLRLDGDAVTLASGAAVLALRAEGGPAPVNLRAGDEVAGWRQGSCLREIRLARIRTDAGRVGDSPLAGSVRLDTGQRVWDLVAWPGVADGPGYLRVCHDGRLVLWAADAAGEVRLPPGPAPSAARGFWSKLRAWRALSV